jgi:hypothetical protein
VPDVTLRRRDLLRFAGVAMAGAALSACTTSGDSTHPSTASPGGPEDPDRALREAVASDEQRLGAAYAAVTGLPASLQARVAVLGSRHAVYAAAVLPESPGASSTGSGSTSGPASGSGSASTAGAVSGSPSGAPPPADQVHGAEVTLRALKALETRAAADRAAQSARATDQELARTIVLAGTGAASAAQVLARLTVSR